MLLISTHAINEMPFELRDTILDQIKSQLSHSFDYYLIFGNDLQYMGENYHTTEISNVYYFERVLGCNDEKSSRSIPFFDGACYTYVGTCFCGGGGGEEK